jgi:hypothetical protein
MIQELKTFGVLKKKLDPENFKIKFYISLEFISLCIIDKILKTIN